MKDSFISPFSILYLSICYPLPIRLRSHLSILGFGLCIILDLSILGFGLCIILFVHLQIINASIPMTQAN